MEISEQTKNELAAAEKEKFLKWNKRINDLAEDIIDAMKEEQLDLKDFNEVIRIAQQRLGNELSKLNLNYIYNSNKPPLGN